MPVGANGRRNDGSIRSAEWRCNGSKDAAAPPKTRLHQPNTAADIAKSTSLEKTLIIYKKIKFYVMKK